MFNIDLLSHMSGHSISYTVLLDYGNRIQIVLPSRRNRVNHFFLGGGSFYLKFAHLLSNF